MLASKKFLSLPIISLKEGQQIGFVRNLVINPKTKSIVALVVDPKGFFKEQRIIPFNKVVSLGENAITISTESQVEKATNLPDILELLREKAAILGIKVITENGKTLGVTDEFYINPQTGQIASIDISEGKIEGLFNGKARLKAEDILTIGPNVIVVDSNCESRLEIYNKGINENLKSFLHVASSKAAEKGQRLNEYWKKTIKGKDKETFNVQEDWDDPLLESEDITLEDITLNEACTTQEQNDNESSEVKTDDKGDII
ncbi:MAG: photosystem reaction center subunit H [Gracilibacter sp. BRH_c7a]|nr:MAG: photosystem reaction center subunit H [Gracilibacter sp. BRH_c7a]